MRRRERQQPEHGSPHEQPLREIVDEFVPDCSEKPAYVVFARELARAERDSYIVHRPSFRVPDYSARTKRIVQKWFERGLRGRLLRLIGQAVLQGRMP
jgi:hypothetical protein